MLTLKRASKHRPGGPWPDNDYDVFDGDRHIRSLEQYVKLGVGSANSNSGTMLAMDPLETYYLKAAELNTLANDKRYAALKREFEHLAYCYLRLIEQAEPNSHLDIADETPRRDDSDPQPPSPQISTRP